MFYILDNGEDFYEEMNLFNGLEVLRAPVMLDPQVRPCGGVGEAVGWAVSVRYEGGVGKMASLSQLCGKWQYDTRGMCCVALQCAV